MTNPSGDIKVFTAEQISIIYKGDKKFVSLEDYERQSEHCTKQLMENEQKHKAMIERIKKEIETHTATGWDIAIQVKDFENKNVEKGKWVSMMWIKEIIDKEIKK